MKEKDSDAAQDKKIAHVREIEKATVPDEEEPTHRAVKHSVGHYVEHDGARAKKGLRKERY